MTQIPLPDTYYGRLVATYLGLIAVTIVSLVVRPTPTTAEGVVIQLLPVAFILWGMFALAHRHETNSQ